MIYFKEEIPISFYARIDSNEDDYLTFIFEMVSYEKISPFGIGTLTNITLYAIITNRTEIELKKEDKKFQMQRDGTVESKRAKSQIQSI